MGLFDDPGGWFKSAASDVAHFIDDPASTVLDVGGRLVSEPFNQSKGGNGAPMQRPGATVPSNSFTIESQDSIITGQAFDFAKVNSSAAIAAVQASSAQSYAALRESSKMVKDAYTDAKGRGAQADSIALGAVALAALVTMAALKRK